MSQECSFDSVEFSNYYTRENVVAVVSNLALFPAQSVTYTSNANFHIPFRGSENIGISFYNLYIKSIYIYFFKSVFLDRQQERSTVKATKHKHVSIFFSLVVIFFFLFITNIHTNS